MLRQLVVLLLAGSCASCRIDTNLGNDRTDAATLEPKVPDSGTDAAQDAPDAAQPIPDAAEPPDANASGPDASWVDAGFVECASLGCEPNSTCKSTPLPSGTVCRASADECDQEEVCNGVGLTCPADEPAPKATYCGDNAWCDGASKVCPQGSGQWKVFPNERWYWTNPLPQGYALHGVWGSGPDDVWAVGDGGTLMHWDGAAWGRVDLGTTASLVGIWGFAKDDVWIGGYEGTLLHWDGGAWTPVSSGTSDPIVDLWGSAPDDLWAVTSRPYQQNGKVLHWNGTGWSAGPDTDATAIWGTGKNDVWAGAGLHWDGRSWAAISPAPPKASGFWGTSATDLWASGDGFLQHWDGAMWTDTGVVGDALSLGGIWGASASDVWVVAYERTTNDLLPGSIVFHWDGAAWTRVDLGTEPSLTEVWGSSASDIWAVGYGGGLLHWDGKRWASASYGTSENVTQVWGTGGSYWAASRLPGPYSGGSSSVAGVVLRWNGSRWVSAPFELGGWVRIGGGAPDDIWLYSFDPPKPDSVYRWNGVQLTAVADGRIPQFVGPNDGFGVAPDDKRRIDRWDGAKWSPWKTFGEPVELVANRADNIWVLKAATWSVWDGAAWTEVPPITLVARFLYPVSKDFAWLTGETAYKIWRWNGTSWDSFGLSAGTWPSSIWGGPDEAWAVGESTFLKWDGTSWEKLPWKGPFVGSLWGAGPDDVWVGGYGGVILHRK